MASRKSIRGYTPQAIAAMRAHTWPGNVRELSNRIQRAVAMAEGEDITPQDLDLAVAPPSATDSLDSLREAHRRIEVELLVKAMNLYHGNVSRMARVLEVSRSTLYRKLRAYGLEQFILSDPSSFHITNSQAHTSNERCRSGVLDETGAESARRLKLPKNHRNRFLNQPPRTVS
jgi:hypothetical protein